MFPNYFVLREAFSVTNLLSTNREYILLPLRRNFLLSLYIKIGKRKKGKCVVIVMFILQNLCLMMFIKI